jgi:hypothetical protein
VLGEIGTLEWTRRTDGLLSRPERARYMAAVIREQVRVAPRLVAYRAGWTNRDAVGIDADALAIPDSQLARDTLADCRATQPPAVVAHALRSFVFARALGAAGKIRHDPELLFVAAMYHDHGVTSLEGRCFTLRGADAAEAQLAGAGRPESERAAAAEAITLHVNPAVALEQGPEAHLAHDGILLDVVGARGWELRREAIEQVRGRYPRQGFTQEARRLLGAQGRALPRSRPAAAFRCGFGVAVGLSPWRD